MSQYLRSRWFGRRVHPVGLATSLWVLWSAFQLISGHYSPVLSSVAAARLGGAQVAIAAVLWAGWWGRNRALLTWGLIYASTSIVLVSVTLAVAYQSLTSSVFGLIFAALDAQSWQCEREDQTRPI